jgi:transposase-like protein
LKESRFPSFACGENRLRSERALLLAIAEMYVQGVSTRRVKRIVEELCGLEVSSSQVSPGCSRTRRPVCGWCPRS